MYGFHLVHWKLSLQYCAIISVSHHFHYRNYLCVMELNGKIVCARFIGICTMVWQAEPKRMHANRHDDCMTCNELAANAMTAPFALNELAAKHYHHTHTHTHICTCTYGETFAWAWESMDRLKVDTDTHIDMDIDIDIDTGNDQRTNASSTIHWMYQQPISIHSATALHLHIL